MSELMYEFWDFLVRQTKAACRTFLYADEELAAEVLQQVQNYVETITLGDHQTVDFGQLEPFVRQAVGELLAAPEPEGGMYRHAVDLRFAEHVADQRALLLAVLIAAADLLPSVDAQLARDILRAHRSHGGGPKELFLAYTALVAKMLRKVRG